MGGGGKWPPSPLPKETLMTVMDTVTEGYRDGGDSANLNIECAYVRTM